MRWGQHEEAGLNNIVESLVDRASWVARVAAKRRWLALGVAVTIAIVSGVGVAAMSDRYEARARIYVDTQTVLGPLMTGLTYQPDIDQQVHMLARTLISRPNVERLVSLLENELDVASAAGRERIVSRLMTEIKIAATGSGNLYEISYRGSSTHAAQRLVEVTVEMFVNHGAGAKRRDSQDAGRFIEEQIRSYEAKLVEAESRLKDFKVRNFAVSGVSTQDYFTRVSALTESVTKLRVELAAAEQSRDTYRRELAAEEPQLPMGRATRYSDSVTDVQARLESQKKHLDDILSRYTEVHPDVTSTRRVIGQLEAEVQERRAAEDREIAGRGKTGKTGKAATSPIYQKLRISLAETEAQVAALRSQLAAQQSQLDEVRSLAGRVPQAEAELAQLNRDYDVIRKNYDVMVARRESASLGVKLDESSQLADFRVIEPPRVSHSPVFPSRLQLALMAVLVCAAAGVAAAVAVDLVWPTFDDASALRLSSDRPVLGTVSKLVPPQGQRAQRAAMWRFAAAFAALMALQATWVAWIAFRTHLQ